MPQLGAEPCLMTPGGRGWAELCARPNPDFNHSPPQIPPPSGPLAGYGNMRWQTAALRVVRTHPFSTSRGAAPSFLFPSKLVTTSSGAGGDRSACTNRQHGTQRRGAKQPHIGKADDTNPTRGPLGHHSGRSQGRAGPKSSSKSTACGIVLHKTPPAAPQFPPQRHSVAAAG